MFASTRHITIPAAIMALVWLVAGCEPPDQPPEDAGGEQFDTGPELDADPDADAPVEDADIGDVEAPCDPQTACQHYCYEKSARCIGERCGGGDPFGSDYSSSEYQVCLEGLVSENDDGQEETFLEGCVERAAASDDACRAFETAGDTYAEQPCDGDEQIHRMCNELLLFVTTLGESVHSACGCDPATTAQQCIEPGDCGDDGFCLGQEMPGDEGVCSSGCYDFDDLIDSPVTPDPSCAEDNGICLHLDDLQMESMGGEYSICQKWCTGRADCPDESVCAPVFPLQDDEALGLCTIEGIWGIDGVFEFCPDGDCPQGTRCYEGTCQPACGDDDVACDIGPCGDDGYCEIDFLELF